MAETWIVRTKGTDTGQLDGGAALAWDCPFAIVNESDTDLIEVREMYVELAHGLSSAVGYLGPVDLVRISSVAGGRDEDVVKHDSSAGNLPSQVLIKRNPDSVTVGSRFRRFVPVGMLHQTFATTFNLPRFGRQGQGKEPLGAVFDVLVPSEQGIILREGEGLALYIPLTGNQSDMRAAVQFNVLATGKTYTARLGFSPKGPGDTMCAIFNGSGSGVVLDVRYIQVTEEVEQSITYPPKCRVLVGPMHVEEAEDLTPLAYNSGNQALASGVKCVKNGYLRLDQFRTEPWWQGQAIYEGAAGQMAQFKVVYAHQRMNARIIEFRCRTQSFPFANRHVIDLVGKGAKTGIRLRKGEGMAVAWGSNLGLFGAAPVVQEVFPMGSNNNDFVAVFTREDVPPAPGGGAGYSRGRVVNP